MRLLEKNVDLRTLSPLTLAFIGDAVYDLMVREQLVCEANRPVGTLNDEKIAIVRCETQAKAAKALLPMLTEDELAAYKRGKNANALTVPKHASRVDYQTATGFEALFGYIYLKGDEKRLREVFQAAVSRETEEAAI